MKKILFLGLSAILAAGFTACKDDVLIEDVPVVDEILEEDGAMFMNIDVLGQDQSRAKFDVGTKDENDIANIWLLFYDSDDVFVSATQVMKNGQTDLTPSEGTGSEGKIFTGIVQVGVKHGLKIPTQILTFINPINPNFETNPDFATLDKVEQATREIIINENGRFAMSKSGFYNEKTGERVIATQFDGQKALFSSRDQAEKAMEAGTAEIVTIYVERYAAKVTVELADEVWKNQMEIPDFIANFATFDNNNNIIKFVPEYWAVNCYEDKTYVTKSFFQLAGDGGMGGYADFNYMDGALTDHGGSPWKWNDEDNHRSYWSQSPSYYVNKYPRVSDDVMDSDEYEAWLGSNKDQSIPANKENRKGGYELNYYSYDDMVKNAAEKTTLKPGLNNRARKFVNDPSQLYVEGEYKSIYVRENTTSGQALQKAADDPLASPRAAIGSVVIVGHYELNGNEINDNDSFFVVGNDSKDYQMIKDEETMYWYFFTNSSSVPLVSNTNGDKIFDDGAVKFVDNRYKNVITIKHPDKGARGTDENNRMVLDSRFVTLQIDKDKYDEVATPIFALLNGKYTLVNEDNIDAVNYQLLCSSGLARQFKGGKGYFNVSIKHTGFGRTGNGNAGLQVSDSKFDWKKVLSGDFGLVRNHSYTVEVTGIGGLANAIPDPSVPIVPPTDPEANYLGAKIVVLNWAVVDTQKVELK
ncbi:MAG: fimbria major subunit [Muribaculaceae bacterium]|nr:fimbria major subunit [Muribaculaceae bacterium]